VSIQSATRLTFSSLANRNYRKFFFGQTVSLIGTWMQITAQTWLVFTLTHSATDIGIVVALQTLPVLVLSPYGGVIADRVDKRKLMIVLQSIMGLQALALAVLALTHSVTYLEVAGLAVVLGLNNSFENPSRQAFVLEMVGAGQVRNAVSLNSTMNNVARAVGPAVAGTLIATVGEGWCFALNSLSFVAVVGSLVAMDKSALMPSTVSVRAKRQVREGIAYVRATSGLAIPLVMMGIVGMLAYEFQVTLPVLAGSVFHGNSGVYGLLMASMGVGAIVGGLWSAAKGKIGSTAMIRAALLFGVAMALVALSPVLVVALVALSLVGFASVSFLAMANSTLQLRSDPQMRGRVMALWAVAFIGTTPIGGPVIGWVTSVFGARIGLGVGALSCVVAALIGLWLVRRARIKRESLESGRS
jgi:MFS family permease